jgi:Domain of unknown function (DUF4403)
MRYFISLLVFVIVTACSRDLPVQGTLGSYQAEIKPSKPQTLSIDFSMHYDSLFSYLQFRPGKVLFNSKNQSDVDFPLELMLLQKPRMQVFSGGKVSLQFPLKIEARPNVAGINTGLIQAKSNLNVDFQWNWQDINHHQVDQLHVNYQWISKPEIRLLGFPVQVHGVVDPLLQRQLPNMQERVLTRLNQSLSPNSLANLLNRVRMNYASPLGSIALRAADVDLHALQFNAEGLTGKLLVRTALYVGDTLNVQTNRWLEMKYQNQSLPFQVLISYEKLKSILLQELHLKDDQLSIQGDSLGLHVTLQGYAKVQSAANFTILPVQMNSNTIGVHVKDLSFSGLPFFMRAHVKRKMMKSLNTYRWSGKDALSLLKQNSWGLNLANGNVQIQQIYYTPVGLSVSGELQGNWELRK